MKNSRHIHTLSLTDTHTHIHICRTWVWTTMSYWSDEDMKTSLETTQMSHGTRIRNSRHIHTLSLTDTHTLIHMCRTWVWTTMSYWSDEDMKTFLEKRLCKDCKLKNVERIGA